MYGPFFLWACAMIGAFYLSIRLGTGFRPLPNWLVLTAFAAGLLVLIVPPFCSPDYVRLMAFICNVPGGFLIMFALTGKMQGRRMW
jgi:hypothetical protein